MIFQDAQFWVLISFLLFVGAVSRPAWRRTRQALDARIHAIERNFKELEMALLETTLTLKAEKKRTRVIRKEVQTLLDETHKEALRLKESLELQLAQDLKDLEKVTIKRFEEKKERTLNQVKEQAIRISRDTTLQILQEVLSPSVQERLINYQIDYLSQHVSLKSSTKHL